MHVTSKQYPTTWLFESNIEIDRHRLEGICNRGHQPYQHHELQRPKYKKAKLWIGQTLRRMLHLPRLHSHSLALWNPCQRIFAQELSLKLDSNNKDEQSNNTNLNKHTKKIPGWQTNYQQCMHGHNIELSKHENVEDIDQVELTTMINANWMRS